MTRAARVSTIAGAWYGLCACLLTLACRAPTACELELRGCRERTAEGACELDEARELVVWTSTRTLRAQVDGAFLAPTKSRVVLHGTQLTLQVPKGARHMTLDAGGHLTTIHFVADDYPRALSVLRKARTDGKWDEAERGLDALAARAREDDCLAARIRSQRARLAFARGRAGEVEAHYRASLPGLLACGRVSEAAADGFALCYLLGEEQRRFAEAERVLGELEPELAQHAEDLGWLAYYRASLALRQAQHGRALEELARAQARAGRLDMRDLSSAALGMEAWLLGTLGRHERSAQLMERTLAALEGGGDCERAALLATAGYQRLMAVEAGQGLLSSAHDVLARAEALMADGCRDPALHARILANVAQARLLEGDTAGAATALTHAEVLHQGHDRGLRGVLLLLRGRLLLGERRSAEALAAYDALVDHARAGGASDFSGQLGRGLALMALERYDDALDALLRSERALTQDLAEVPLSAGRESFALGRDDLARALVDTLLALGRVAEARDAARRARSRVLGSMPSGPVEPGALAAYGAIEALRAELEREAARDWALPESERPAANVRRQARREDLRRLLDALPAKSPTAVVRDPGPGELLLVVFPDAQGARVFVQTPHGTEHVRIARPEALPEALAVQLGAAARITLIAPEHGPYAELARVSYEGEPLGLRLPVQHALDVAQPPQAAEREGELFVLDPRGDLRGAGRELPEARLLHARVLRGDEATRSALLAELAGVARFHFAGHAWFSRERALDHGLLLSGAAELTTSDVLGLVRAPTHVVLAACDTGSTRRAGYALGLGLAHAFVLRGAATVIATTAPVADESARVFSAAFYEDVGEIDEVVRFQRALAALHARGLDWESYRLFVP